jgi:hypothetical protein
MLQFLVIVLIGGVIGYFLGRSKYGDSLQDTFDRSKTSVTGVYQKNFGKGKKEPENTSHEEEVTQDSE